MEKDFDLTHKKYSGERVIERGYAIYDEWKEKKLSSRKVVAFVERAVSLAKQKKAGAASIEALACLFAMDMRIKTKYNTIFKCLFRYFSWRREARALSLLKIGLSIPASEADVRTAIEVVLKKLREKIENGEEDDEDDETRGGKQTKKEAQDAVNAEGHQQQEQASDDAATEEAPEDEKSEETEQSEEELAKEHHENTRLENQTKETQEPREIPQALQEEADTSERHESKEQTAQEERSEQREENTVFEQASEPNTKNNIETNTYDNRLDYVPIVEEHERKKDDQKLSFIDEVILDNMVKTKPNTDGYEHSDILIRDKEAAHTDDTQMQRNIDARNAEKQAYLYDMMLLRGIEGVQQNTENPISTNNDPQIKEQVKPTEEKTEPVEKPEENKDLKVIEEEFENFRAPLNLGAEFDVENFVRQGASSNMSGESMANIYRMHADAMKEQLNIVVAELGIEDPNDPVNIIGYPDDPQEDQINDAPKLK